LDFLKTKIILIRILENEKGVRWEVNTKDEYRVLNFHGTKEVMRILSMYLTKDVILGEVESKEINQVLETLGHELNDLFFTKYDEIGLDTPSKKKNYSMIITTLLHHLKFVLSRAKDGKERRSVTENRSVQQSEIVYPQGMQNKQNWASRIFG
jgi:hypothetical protein